MNYYIEDSKDGYKIVKTKIDNKYKYIGSKYNQSNEIKKIIDDIGIFKSNDIYIIFGLGCGEHLREILKRKKSKYRILVIEHNDELIEYVKKNYGFENEKQIIITNKDDEIKAYISSIKSHLINNVRVFHYTNYSKIFINDVRKSFDFIKDCMQEVLINRNTELRFFEQWFESKISNLKASANSTPANVLKNKFENIPAIVVSAGPSLEKNIDYLKGFENGFIFTGGRTLRALLNKGINPNAIVGLDAAPESYDLVKSVIKDIKIPLVFNETTNIDIVKNHSYKKYIFGNNDFIDQIIGDSLVNFVGGGSVAHAITKFAIYLGCNPIIFVGQDLAYTGEKGHANIAYNEFDKEIIGLDDEAIFEKKYKKSSDVYVKDIHGNDVRTTPILRDFIKSFEYIIENEKNIKFIDATEGGAFIKGTEIRQLKSVLSEINNLDKQEINLEKYIIEKNDEELLRKYIKSLKSDIKLCLNNCESGLKELDLLKVNYLIGKNIDVHLKKLDYIDKTIRESKSVSYIHDFIYKNIYDIESDDDLQINNHDSDKEKMIKIYNKNKIIYKKIFEKINILKREINNNF